MALIVATSVRVDHESVTITHLRADLEKILRTLG